jgi:predicted DNA-binding transcriptional regulator YafY
MLAERLVSILTLLADGRLHSGPELAGRFGVSLRSVYRDMERLSGMGVPIEAVGGREGGFRVLPGYTLDRSVLDEGEIATVTAALSGIGRAIGGGPTEAARSKLRALLGKSPERRRSWIRIELSGGSRVRGLVETLRGAIEERRLLLVRYRDSNGSVTDRGVEPRAVVYIGQSWYLWAFCRLRRDWRLFKLLRIESARALLERFEERPEPSEEAWRSEWEGGEAEPVLVEIRPEAAARGAEWFGPGEKREDGGIRYRLSLPRNDWLLGFILSFGEGLRVLEPESLALAVALRARRIAASYESRDFPKNPDKS